MKDECRRADDILINELILEFREMREELRDARQDTQEWREKYEDRLAIIERFIQKIGTPVKAIQWIGGIILVSVFGKIGISIFEYCNRHWQG